MVYLKAYIILGFVLNLGYLIVHKVRIPEQRPQSFLEVCYMFVLFLVGLVLWPVAWYVRIQDWAQK